MADRKTRPNEPQPEAQFPDTADATEPQPGAQFAETESSTEPQPGGQLAVPVSSGRGFQWPEEPLDVDARVRMRRADSILTPDHALWTAIRTRTNAIGFDSYYDFINRVLCADTDQGNPVCGERRNITAEDIGAPPIEDRREALLDLPSIYGVDAYNLLKLATQAFLLFETGVVIKRPRDPQTGRETGSGTDIVPGEESRTGEKFNFNDLSDKLEAYLRPTVGDVRGLPYLKRIVRALTERRAESLPYCLDLLRHRFSCPSLQELIWSYWNEEGMLVQTMNALCLRFQNKRGPADRDPLANLEIDPLRPLNNVIWGYIQDEYHRLTVPRRAYEYDHHYGFSLYGKAVPELRAADSRSKFVEAFHNLLYRAAIFYREDADTTVIADGFQLLNSLREVHLLLAEGAHNQFGDLPWTSRAEMLMMQWLLARPEMREFLRGRAMVPYQEAWMGQVDTMKRLQGWTDTSITHFRYLATYGEQMLLSIRYGDWIDINEQDHAKTWARYWRPEVQGYIHAYLSATGVDLSEDVVDTRGAQARSVQPSVLLRDRLAGQGQRIELPSASVRGTLTGAGTSAQALPAPRRRGLKPARRD
ncbi:MAG: hypothetical protein ACREBD_09810 [Blastocatellia bacterium]